MMIMIYILWRLCVTFRHGDSADDMGQKDHDRQFYDNLKLQIAWEDLDTFHYRELLESIAVSKEHLMFIISFHDQLIIDYY